MFADAITDGNIAKLFEQMEDGKVGLEELSKVIDHLATLTDDQILAKMMNTPAKKFEQMRNSWIRTLEALNRSGVLDLLIAIFSEAATLLEEVATLVKDNQEFFKDLGEIIKSVYRAGKAFVIMIVDLVEAFAPLVKTIALLAGGGLLALAFRPILTGALAGQTLLAVTALNKLGAVVRTLLIRFLLIPVAVALMGAAVLEVYDTLLGKDTLFTRLSEQKDKGLLGWLAAITRGLFEILSLSAKGLVGGFHFITGNADERQAAADFLRESGQDFASKMDKMGFTAEMTRNWDTNKQAITDMFTGGGNQSIRYLGQNQNTSAPVTNQFNMTINPPTGDPIQIAEIVSQTLADTFNKGMTNYADQR